MVIVESSPKLDHEWGEATFDWSIGDDAKATCTARVNCTRELNGTTCSGSYTYTISNISGVVDAGGNTTYTANFGEATALSEEFKTKFGVQTYTIPIQQA